MARPDYLELTYAETRLPKTGYPAQLAAWLVRHWFTHPGLLVDVGCGRGEYLRLFAGHGFPVVGIDAAASARAAVPGLRVDIANVDTDRFPIATGVADYVYSKSVIEHLQRPDHMLAECVRVLKPGGLAVIMTPSWRHQRRIFYEDYTHVRPFTVNGLSDAMTLAGLVDVRVQLFWQLPVLWTHPWLEPAIRACAWLPFRYRPWDQAPWPDAMNTLLRFAKEVMLLGTGRRPRDPDREDA